ncbi:basic phospholipase A2 10-like isoform X2 [Branchiostoma floridae x Branchiostoma japonicum]
MQNIFTGAILWGALSLVAARNLPRNLYQFGTLIELITGRDAWDYNNYGCWCGSGGSGTPVDRIDFCCLNHDRCYDNLIANGWSPHYVTYDWTQYDIGIGCDDPYPSSDRGACECDLAAAHCFSHFPYPDTGKPACPDQSTGLPGCFDSDPSLCIAIG